MDEKITTANQLREDNNDKSFLMKLSIEKIAKIRSEILEDQENKAGIAKKHAYIIRQLKLPDEVTLLREVYGKQFVLISGYGSEADRKNILITKGKSFLSPTTPASDLEKKAADLIVRDQNEQGTAHGQNIRETFHLADVFIDGIVRDKISEGLTRFIKAFFGDTKIGPTKSEYGMYSAKAASLRSTDLSRQVGATILNDAGDIISSGCNEVPKAGGGNYWYDEQPDFRDVVIGYDPNETIKQYVLRDLLEKLHDAKLLKVREKSAATSPQFVEKLLGKPDPSDPKAGCLKGALITDLTEYGRVVHAEMSAICDAARSGRAVKDGILYVTTFPCHGCTKHIISSGISKVVYLEPYPKSKAKELHSNEIEIEGINEGKVSFTPFLGISPFRYRDIFEKKSRKTGPNARKWYSTSDLPQPMTASIFPYYIELEKIVIDMIYGTFSAPQEN